MATSSHSEMRSNQNDQESNNVTNINNNNNYKESTDQMAEPVNETNNNPDRGVIGSASDNIWNIGVGAVKGISWTLSSTYNYSVGLINRSYSLKMKDKNE